MTQQECYYLKVKFLTLQFLIFHMSQTSQVSFISISFLNERLFSEGFPPFVSKVKLKNKLKSPVSDLRLTCISSEVESNGVKSSRVFNCFVSV